MQNSKNQQEFYVGLAIYEGGFIIKNLYYQVKIS